MLGWKSTLYFLGSPVSENVQGQSFCNFIAVFKNDLEFDLLLNYIFIFIDYFMVNCYKFSVAQEQIHANIQNWTWVFNVGIQVYQDLLGTSIYKHPYVYFFVSLMLFYIYVVRYVGIRYLT